MKLFKLTGWILISLLILTVAVVAVFMATFDANEYKENLSKLIQEKTGRAVEFRGDISLSFYPSLGMQLGELQLANADGFGDFPMLQIKQVRVSVDLLSIIKFKPHIAQLVLDGLVLDLQKNSSGITNWDDLVKQDQTKADIPDEKKTTEKDTASIPPVFFDGLLITNAKLNWLDKQTDQSLSLKIVKIKTGAIADQQKFPLSIELQTELNKGLKADLELAVSVLFDSAKKQLSLDNLKLNLDATGKMLPVDTLVLKLAGDMDWFMESGQIGIKGFNTQVETAGGLMQQVDLSLAGELGYSINKKQLTIGVLELEAILIGPQFADEKLKAVMSSKLLKLNHDKSSLHLSDLELALNDNRFTGYIDMADYQQPDVKFELTSDSFDIDSLLAEGQNTPEPGTEIEASDPDAKINLPIDLLKSLKLDGKIAIKKIKVKKLNFANMQMHATANKGRVKIKPFSLDLYQGHLNAEVGLDVNPALPVYKVSYKLTKMQIGEFLQDFMDQKKITGAAKSNASLTTKGDSVRNLKQNLNGNLALQLKDGAIQGFNLSYQIDRARALYKRKDAPEEQPDQTEFGALSLSGVVKQGIFSSDDLKLLAPLLRVKGAGEVDLAKETLDYNVQARIVDSLKVEDTGDKGLLIPVEITGPWAAPKIDVQYDELLKKMARERLKAEQEKLKKQVEQHKAELKQQLAEEKAKLKLAKQRKEAALKKELDAKKRLLIQKQKAEQEKQKAKLKTKADKKKAEAKQKLKDKLKKLF